MVWWPNRQVTAFDLRRDGLETADHPIPRVDLEHEDDGEPPVRVYGTERADLVEVFRG